MTSAQDAFAQVVATLSACRAETTSGPAQQAAKRLGFVDHEHNDEQVLCLLRFWDAAGNSATLKETWPGPAQPAPGTPDTHRIRVILAVTGQADVEEMIEFEA
ncbi:hypothetical protein [Acidovorax sp. A1169]|uniref:hypothetical protein n=1 Tax=Acidovorax sp. A1169 TaxID=3059524 RepID=UPI00273790EF|nr:hypothetical protein [Acidovorax sp. A1169]MDP4077036.1 hypothetical protein [Acidovorax sp. A1169]